ncbi:MAG: Uma2 family endonuclease [Gammaproteobacteria bacterium]
MMSYPANAERMSAEEFLEWEERQSEKHEFIRGETFAMVGVTRQHATVAGNVFRFLGNQLEGTRCRSYMADMKLKLEAADAFFYPDVFVTCSEADHQAERYMTEPRLIVEVLSESTEAYDRGEKFEKYRQFPSLLEYALINPAKHKAEIFRRDATNHWVLYEYGGDEVVLFASLELTIESAVLYENVD